jgi:hypothetical protein
MGDLGRSVMNGGIYSKTQKVDNLEHCDINSLFDYHKSQAQSNKLEDLGEKSWETAKKLFKSVKIKSKKHIWEKQDVYLSVLIAIILLALVFVSKTAFSKTPDNTNNLPIMDKYKVKLINTNLSGTGEKMCSFAGILTPQDKPADIVVAKKDEDLKSDVEKIVANTPMAAMTESISGKPRTVAAFIVGIAMKESKFGVYSPRIGGHDCYNYWGLKAGGKTTSGGYTCFSSPDEAVSVVGKTIEKMLAKGVRTPAQAISWKCGSSCAGHGTENVRKWISDVNINFYKLVNS